MSAFLLGQGFRADMGTCARKLVLLKLIDACEDDGSRIFPAVATVARAAQCSARQVQRELSEFVRIGLLAIIDEGGGRGRPREYAMDMDMLARLAKEGWNAVVGALAPAGKKGDTVSPFPQDRVEAERVTPETERVTPEAVKGDKLCHPTPYIDPLDPSEREGASATGQEGGQETLAPADTPGRADFERRVLWYCNGHGYMAGAWPNWDTGASPGWVATQFARLSPDERLEAERWRDAYLLDLADRKKDPVAVGNFLKSRMWIALDPAILKRMDDRRAAQLKPDERAKPDGWAAMAGPVGMAMLFDALIAGPSDRAAAEDLARRAFFADAALRKAWEHVWRWRALLRQKGGAPFGPRWHALKPAMEPVPVSSDVVSAWREAFAARGWPWLSEFERGEVFYAPKGGPERLGEFEAAIRGGNDGKRAEIHDQAC